VTEPTETASLRIRQAVRALLLTPTNEVLLVRFEFPTRQVWALPGGGLDPGEDHLTALHRELAEETGLTGADVGPHIWTREHMIPFLDGTYDGQRDQIHLVRTHRFDPFPSIGWEQMRAERVHEMRWWNVDEISSHAERVATNEAAAIGFAPDSFALMLRQLIDDGIPVEPLLTGV
jgi:8-oxo-dGTP pyrophosphatase MutT (NUDIX family)